VTDDPGVMGNLPRSRPGRRSDKRATPGAKKPAARARSAAPKPKAQARPRSEPSRPAPERHDPITDAVRIGVRIAGAGLGLAAGIARRLPRP